MSEVLIKVDKVSKKFSRNFKKALWYGVTDIAREIIGRRRDSDQLRTDEFWAVKNVTFEVRRGECLGLIGHNGAGKSSLLKLLNGLIKPDQGKIEIRGKVGALIELGAGFNPILTGRENIYVNGSILGFSSSEIESKIEAILDFAELRDFIDTPVQFYSSGMKVRLGFAIAAQMSPDVLLVDEVLSVGDVGFKIKSLEKITELLPNTAVIFISHNMPQIAKICTSLGLMKKGRLENFANNVIEGIEKYYDQYNGEKYYVVGNSIEVKNLNINMQNPELVLVKYNQDLKLAFVIKTEKKLSKIKVVIVFVDRNLKPLASCLSDEIKFEEDENEKYVEVVIPNLQFAFGRYSINLNFHKCTQGNQMLLVSRHNAVGEISVSGLDLVNQTSIHLIGNWKI